MRIIYFFVILILIFSFAYYGLYSKGVNFVTYTKALCNEKVCADYLITCNNEEVISTQRITGFVTFGDDWQDVRENKEISC